jgi:hypothetical protein
MTALVPTSTPPAGESFVLAKGSLGDGTPADAPVNLLGRCKQCRTGLRATGALRGYAGKDSWGVRCVFQLADGGAVGLAHCNSWGHGLIVNCPACAAAGKRDGIGQPVRALLAPVLGRFNQSKKCDGRCTSATGHNCECQCGGRNHGSDHG